MRIIGSLAGYIFVCLLMLASATASGANESGKTIGEPDWDWRPGDLIFRNGMNGFDDRLREASGWKWASIGILRSASAGVRVLYVDENKGVLEQTFEDYVSGLSTEEYVVYRAKALVASDPEGQMLQGPLAKYGLFVAYGAPFDTWVAPAMTDTPLPTARPRQH